MADAATVVLLVRHGLTPTTGIKLPGQAPGLHLTDEGRRQAEAAAARIKGLPKVAAVYSSHLERARETAAPIARALVFFISTPPWSATLAQPGREDKAGGRAAANAAGLSACAH